MIIEVKDEFVWDFILLVHVDIEAEYPYVEDEDSDSSPNGEIPWKAVVFVKTNMIDSDNHNEQNQKRDTDSDP